MFKSIPLQSIIIIWSSFGTKIYRYKERKRGREKEVKVVIEREKGTKI